MDFTSLPLFRHRPLSGPRNIRVLHVINPENPLDQLKCGLQEVSLDDYYPYTALSYAWDTELPTEPMLCSNILTMSAEDIGVLLITPNCKKALLRMRRYAECQIMWIDSICIDQTSIDERNQQVALMGEVYERARRVNIWLGESDEKIDFLMGWIKKVTDLPGAEGSLEVNQKVQELSTDITNEALKAFWCRSWFQRMWVVQEVILAQLGSGRIEVHCGDSRLPWASVLLFAMYLRDRLFYYEAKRAMSMFLYLSIIMSDLKLKNNLYMGLASTILVETRHRHCREPRDRIFAFYSIFKKLGIRIQEPDYRRSLADIFREVTSTAIRFDNCLDLVLTAIPVTDRGYLSLPSWVPDWASPPHLVDYNILQLYDTKPTGRMIRHTTRAIYQFLADDKVLRIRGKLIAVAEVFLRVQHDQATHTSLMMQMNEPNKYDAYLKLQYSACSTFHNWLSRASTRDGENLEYFLKACMFYEVSNSPSSFITDEQWQHWKNFIHEVHHLQGQMTTIWAHSEKDMIQKFAQLKEDLLEDDIISVTAMQYSAGKRLFTTENDLLGIGFGDFSTGDLVAKVAGLSELIIIRKVDSGYRLLSKCYIPGISNGELWPEDENELVEIDLI